MRCITILLIVLSVTVSVNAGVFISVNGVTNPSDPVFVIPPTGTASIGLWGDGMSGQGSYFLGITENSPASLDVDHIIVSYPDQPYPPYIIWDPILGLKPPVIEFGFFDMTPPEAPLSGQLADNVILHADNWGVTVIQLYAWEDMGDPILLDTQEVLQIPEPATIALMGLGMMLLKRRR